MELLSEGDGTIDESIASEGEEYETEDDSTEGDEDIHRVAVICLGNYREKQEKARKILFLKTHWRKRRKLIQ